MSVVNKIIWDVNNQVEYRLSEQHVSVVDAVIGAIDILKGRIAKTVHARHP